ncbi:molybdopterin molybdenumtransferase MoeA, partial [Clostridium perfringens]|nr:molybdopterin molybdenumtransferase MoeA [Clostridium perfringens]
NRVISESIYSKINNPPFDKSAMDGYAVVAKDTIRNGKKLKVIDKVYAGEVCNSSVSENMAIRIMTGAPITKGATAVIKQEDVVIDKEFIIVKKSVNTKENICIKGEDIEKGGLILEENKKLNYADIG